jgi:hypothetical protein
MLDMTRHTSPPPVADVYNPSTLDAMRWSIVPNPLLLREVAVRKVHPGRHRDTRLS